MISLLMVVVLLGVLMTITSNLSLSSRRITGDQRAIQQAQFAAESGLALAYARRKEAYTLINAMNIPSTVTDASLAADIQNFCDGTALSTGSGASSCTSNPNATSANKYSLFTNYITTGYPTSVTPSAYWQDVFYDAGGSTPKQVQQVVSTYGGATNRYTLTGYGLIPVGAQRLGPGRYQLSFNLAASQLKGEVMVAGNVVSTRKVTLSMPSTTYTLTISRPSFAQYVLFRNQTTNTSGSQLYFSGAETFNGPVHTNGTPGFAGSPGPTFSGKFTSAASSFSGINGFACSSVAQLAGTCASNFTAGPPQFSQSAIPLPPNSNNQIRASYGGDATNTAAVTTAELNTAWGVPSVIPGVYYSAGNGAIRNTGSSWQGGLYISGTVDSMTLSTSGGYQVITIVQGLTTTVFTQQSNGTWTVTVNGVLVKTLSASPAFNGMIYVAGSVTSLNGGGTTAADIASGSQLTLATSGDVNINKDITYTDDPRISPLATNVLGIYSSGGNVKIDGPLGQDLNVQASIMATAGGHGFGSVKYNQDIGGKHINLLGGIIEDQSQTVGTLGTPYGGYQRNYEYDPRFNLGFAPPFFPLQQQWSDSVVDFSKPKTVWETREN